jgi:hypothetical protein
MAAGRALAMTALVAGLSGCGLLSGDDGASKSKAMDETDAIRIVLNADQPDLSKGVLYDAQAPLHFNVGFGRHGIACAGSTFQEGITPLGTFKVNAILSSTKFEMDPSLVTKSGKSEVELRQNLFRDMNAIDFKGDGETGEYGAGYISLAPVENTDQPFRFNTYDGKFRWYSFAIHGTNDDSRVGKAVTGGCINVNQAALKTLLNTVELGDEVVISSDSPCLS